MFLFAFLFFFLASCYLALFSLRWARLIFISFLSKIDEDYVASDGIKPQPKKKKKCDKYKETERKS